MALGMQHIDPCIGEPVVEPAHEAGIAPVDRHHRRIDRELPGRIGGGIIGDDERINATTRRLAAQIGDDPLAPANDEIGQQMRDADHLWLSAP